MTKRDYFDQQVEWVLARLPRRILRLLEACPLHVEDKPSKYLMRELRVDSDELCGCFIGMSINRHYELIQQLPNSVMIFRKGIFAASADESGIARRSELRRQIRITILHELGHYHGMSEQEIEAIGYG